ncbi:hypothetical protein GLW00_14785 [Halobacillus litoralis]|uniref:DUF4367 domain-containing protein n=1 Tax=Halobacillus litoralis TaxID=45668 RepID=A0A845FES2_9BACI|nr:hypothetical protein [Halobacillus litoralis]MYL72126.1 hypothetical protein [Halobacillus litoralis]
MWRRFGVLFFCLLLVSACSKTHAIPSGYHSYNLEKVSSAVEQLDFQPELPEYIPVPMISVVTDIYQSEGSVLMDLSFYTPDNDLLTIQFSQGEINTPWIDPEELSILGNLDGLYENNRFSKKLTWTKDGVTYLMTYRASVAHEEDNEQSVTRQQLVEVARSFHS